MYDICIIGSGAGAGPVAFELSQAGFKVAVLEKGPWLKRANFFKDEIALCRRSTLTPRLDLEQHVIEEKEDGAWVSRSTSESGRDLWNGSMVGGSSNLMSGFFHRLKPKDFSLLSSYGPIAGANIVDWPIGYAEMEPYYAKVERVVGVSGKVVPHPFLEPRSTADYPYPPTMEHGITRWFDKTCAKQKLFSIPTARAVLPFRVGERGGCEYAGYCGSYGCASGAKGSSREALLNQALKSGKLSIIPEAFVKRLLSKERRVTAAEYVDKQGQTHKLKAKLFVLAAQAIESSRLLLNSVSRSFPQGLANNGGQVGKNLIFSAGGVGEGIFDYEDFSSEELQMLQAVGPFVNRSLQDWYEIKSGQSTLKGGTVDFLFEHPNAISKAKRLLNEELVWGDKLKSRLLKRFRKERRINFEIFCDWLPTDDTFVSLDPKVKDRWGMPVAKLRLSAHKHDLWLGEKIAFECEKILKEMGAKDVSSSISADPPPNLVAGGCRFGDDPHSSVLDRDCKAHEVENLYVTDASFMPTGGSVPYTWTIYANAFRVADKIIKRLRESQS